MVLKTISWLSNSFLNSTPPRSIRESHRANAILLYLYIPTSFISIWSVVLFKWAPCEKETINFWGLREVLGKRLNSFFKVYIKRTRGFFYFRYFGSFLNISFICVPLALRILHAFIIFLFGTVAIFFYTVAISGFIYSFVYDQKKVRYWKSIFFFFFFNTPSLLRLSVLGYFVKICGSYILKKNCIVFSNFGKDEFVFNKVCRIKKRRISWIQSENEKALLERCEFRYKNPIGANKCFYIKTNSKNEFLFIIIFHFIVVELGYKLNLSKNEE